MVSENDSLFKVLKDSTRQRIVLLLQKEQPLTYVELMAHSKVSNTGRLNYHLKILADFLEKDSDGKYRLTEKGSQVAQLLANGPTWNLDENNRANLRSIALIGTFGFTLVLFNPAIFENFVGMPLVVGLWPSILATAYGFLVPGAFMWFLGRKYLRNHEVRSLMKAPLFSVLLLVCFVIALGLLEWLAPMVWGIRIGFPLLQKGISESQTIIQNGHEVMRIQQMTYGSLPILMLPIAGIYSFVGFFVAETVQRLRNRN